MQMLEKLLTMRIRVVYAMGLYVACALSLVALASLLRLATTTAYPFLLILTGPLQLLTSYFEYPEAFRDPVAITANAIPLCLCVAYAIQKGEALRVITLCLFLVYWLLSGIYYYRAVGYGLA